MGKLYIVEGIPGSGKTTFARKLASQLRQTSDPVNLYMESDLHPTDMAWCALLKQNEFEKVQHTYPDLAEDISNNSSKWKDYQIVAYTKIHNLTPELYGYMEGKEVYDGRVSVDTFCQLQESRWKQFGENAQETYIFECALLQNSINELVLFGGMSEKMICDYIGRLLESVKSLEPEIIYLNVDTNKVLDRAVAERVNRTGEHVWENMISNYIENSPWGKEYHLKGSIGIRAYFAYRQKLEMKILDSLQVKKHILKIDANRQSEIVDEWMKNCSC